MRQRVHVRWKFWSMAAVAALLSLPVTACSEKEQEPSDMFGTSVTPMDHDPSDTFVRNVYVNGRWVGSAGTGASSVLGGISLPHQWRPGLTAVVKWERCEPYGKNCRWTEKVVPIQKYDGVWVTWLHLLPRDEVLLIPSDTGPGGPGYPGPDFPTKDFFKNSNKDASE